jgi:hypothetical protein
MTWHRWQPPRRRRPAGTAICGHQITQRQPRPARHGHIRAPYFEFSTTNRFNRALSISFFRIDSGTKAGSCAGDDTDMTTPVHRPLRRPASARTRDTHRGSVHTLGRHSAAPALAAVKPQLSDRGACRTARASGVVVRVAHPLITVVAQLGRLCRSSAQAHSRSPR